MNGPVTIASRRTSVQTVMGALLVLFPTTCSARLTVEGGQRVASDLLAALTQGKLRVLDQYHADKFCAREHREECI